VEVNNHDIVYLENLTGQVARKKVTLQLFGVHTLRMRSRCLSDSKELRLTVANPRIVVLTSPLAFDPEVVSRIAAVGGRKHAATVRGLLDPAGDLLKGASLSLQPNTGGISAAKMVIHELMPKFTTQVIDLLEAKCFKFARQSKGLDMALLAATREEEHQEIIVMLNKAVSYVMGYVFLDRLDLEGNPDLLQTRYPHLMDMYELIKDDSLDEDEEDDIPKILKKQKIGGDDAPYEPLPPPDAALQVQEWILRLCHTVRNQAFLGTPKLEILQGFAEEKGEGFDRYAMLFQEEDSERTKWSACRAVLNILQELLVRNDEIEEEWASRIANSSFCQSGKLNITYVTQKASLFSPFSFGEGGLNASRLRRFFVEAQVPEVDPLMLVSVLLYHPQAAAMRLEAFTLGCRILRDPNPNLQEAYKGHTEAQMHLQKAMGYQFSSFQSCYRKAVYTDNDVDMMAGMLKLIQQLCEGHKADLQEFLGEDYTAEVLNIFSKKQTYDDDDDDNKKDEPDDDDEDTSGEPNNIVQWTSQMIKMILSSMRSAQDWQASMEGREKQYILVQQLFETAAELIQGPNRANQALLLENDICADVNRLWLIVRIDEFAFRGLIQDNEDLFDSWMDLLKAMRLAEVAALRFLLSLHEEEELDEDDAEFAEMAEAVIEHKTQTVKRMIEELSPKALADKIITHWNLSKEVDDLKYYIEPRKEEEENIEYDTADKVERPKREVQCETYVLEEQKDDCLEICALCYSVFMAVYFAPEARNPLYKQIQIERIPDPTRKLFTFNTWSSNKTKVFDHFLETVAKTRNEKYLHFLFGQVEIQRGSRLQRMFFVVPPPIRTLKDHPLVHSWQEKCQQEVDRSSPEAQIDSFSDAVMAQYIPFVLTQYELLNNPWPFNKAGEVISFCMKTTMFTTCIINAILVNTYTGSYSHHSILNSDLHFQNHVWIYLLTAFTSVHLAFSLIWLLFHILSYRQHIIDAGVDEWKEANPRLVSMLNNPAYKFYLSTTIFFSDKELLYNMFLVLCSFLGRYVNFLFNSVNTIDLCMNVPILYKVIQSINNSVKSVLGTMILGFCLQYIFVGYGFIFFSAAYGFADMDTGGCATLIECLKAHWDYGFRSAPVWHSNKLTGMRFTFDYFYNLSIILIMAAIISGIIIDTFADLKEEQTFIEDEQKSKCFICSLTKSELERAKVKFQKHIIEDHYMWAYARFLLFLDQEDPSSLAGPESYVKQLIKENNSTYFPNKRCIEMESGESGEGHLERVCRVRDMDDFRAPLKSIADNTEVIKKAENQFKMELKELRATVLGFTQVLQKLSTLMASQDEDDKKKKKKKKGG